MKPFIKWVGGKTQILKETLSHFPNTIENYHEPFVGGGSVLFDILSKNIVKGKIYTYDTNINLINLYKNVQSNVDVLYTKLSKLYEDYESCGDGELNRKPQSLLEAKVKKENYYYWIRNKFNTTNDTLEKSAMFIFLNKTCFRGIYREGPNGFNVPYGNYKKVNIIEKYELQKISDLIKDVKFECLDFRKSLKNVKPKDFVYLDPPYAPETKNSFVGYTKDGFTLEDHKELFKIIKENLNNFVMSNSNVQLVNDYFSDYNKKVIIAKRSINSKNPESKTEEIIISKSSF